MRALVVFESTWGGTRTVAEAVGRGIDADATVLEVAEVSSSLPADVDLLVVGGPTHAFSAKRRDARRARQGAEEGHRRRGIREWLDALPFSERLVVATFDTQVLTGTRRAGSAATAVGTEVRRRRHLAGPVATASFYVDDADGRLASGELERAESWGAGLTALRGGPGTAE